MAELVGSNYDKAYNNSEMVAPGEFNSHVKYIYEEYTFAAETGAADTLLVGKIPAGARVVSAQMKSPDLGGTGTIDLGYQASDSDVADPDGFVVAADHSGQAAQTNGSGAGILKKFDSETIVQALFTGVTGSATGKTLQFIIGYLKD